MPSVLQAHRRQKEKWKRNSPRTIVEPFTANSVPEIVTRLRDPIRNAPELLGHSKLTEDGGKIADG
jgi:hypothetical protein